MDDDLLPFQILFQLLLILTNAIFACAEIALISINENRLEKMSLKGDKKAKQLLKLTAEPAKFLATIQVCITLAGFLGSAFAADNFSGKLTALLVSSGVKIPAEVFAKVSLVIITIVLSFITLVFGELVPKRLAMKKAEKLAFAMAGFISFTSKLFSPVVRLLTISTNGILRLLGIDPEAESDAVTEEEIRLMIDMGSARGIIKSGEKEILHNVFEFDDKTAAEVMTHRRDCVILRLEENDGQWEKTIIGSKHNYFPVCGEDTDDIRGVLYTRDYLCLVDRSRESVLNNAVKPAVLIPTSIKTDALFRKMKKSGNHFALVIDEHGGMMGIVTINDLLEEIVGDLEDDINAPDEKSLIKKINDDCWEIGGAVPLDKVARDLDIPLPIDRYDTFAGFVFSALGFIPDKAGPEVEADGLKIKIVEIKNRRLEKALVFIADREV